MIAKLRRFLFGMRDYLNGRSPAELVMKGYRLLRREGLAGLLRIYRDTLSIGYSEWIRRYDTLSADDRVVIRRQIDAMAYRPVFSVLMPVYNPPAKFLRLAIESVRSQLYPDWELCIADDASTEPEVRQVLEEAVESDLRIRVVHRPLNEHISVATNTALEVATGEFIALLDHDDELPEHALYHVAVALNANRALDLLYSDEDKIDAEGNRFGHYFKPDWNPDLFLGQNLISHLGVYRRTLALEIGGFRKGYEGSQDWDFSLRFTERVPASHIFHIPHILYHWRAIRGSTAFSIAAKRYAVDAGRRAIVDYWHRQRVTASVTAVGAGHFITQLPLPSDPPLVSIIVCTGNRRDLLQPCIDGVLERTDYPNLEIIIVDNGSDEISALRYLASLADSGKVKVIREDSPFNFAALNNLAVTHARGKIVCLLNNDIEPITPSWLGVMVANALRPEIGAVGAKLYYPDGRIQHASVVLNGVAAGHLHLGYPGGAAGYGGRALLGQNFCAVTGACMVIRKAIWEQVGGMDESFAVAFNDIDICLRVRESGYRNLWLPQAKLYHHESASRGPEDSPEKQARLGAEVALLRERWASEIDSDPAWNPNLEYNLASVTLASPPRIIRPWQSVHS
jgi:O-antigen biosynthesis protein